MRYQEILESVGTQKSYRLFHGSGYGDITEFRLENLRHRTGTPGTLSFTTSIDTAKIYGEHIYEAEITGIFGDYLNPDDVQKNFDFRWAKDVAYYNAVNQKFSNPFNGMSLEDLLAKIKERLTRDITKGEYAMWENVFLWKVFGWDGAWCHESGSRNLIIGNINCVRMVGKVI